MTQTRRKLKINPLIHGTFSRHFEKVPDMARNACTLLEQTAKRTISTMCNIHTKQTLMLYTIFIQSYTIFKIFVNSISAVKVFRYVSQVHNCEYTRNHTCTLRKIFIISWFHATFHPFLNGSFNWMFRCKVKINYSNKKISLKKLHSKPFSITQQITFLWSLTSQNPVRKQTKRPKENKVPRYIREI